MLPKIIIGFLIGCLWLPKFSCAQTVPSIVELPSCHIVFNKFRIVKKGPGIHRTMQVSGEIINNTGEIVSFRRRELINLFQSAILHDKGVVYQIDQLNVMDRPPYANLVFDAVLVRQKTNVFSFEYETDTKALILANSRFYSFGDRAMRPTNIQFSVCRPVICTNKTSLAEILARGHGDIEVQWPKDK